MLSRACIPFAILLCIHNISASKWCVPGSEVDERDFGILIKDSCTIKAYPADQKESGRYLMDMRNRPDRPGRPTRPSRPNKPGKPKRPKPGYQIATIERELRHGINISISTNAPGILFHVGGKVTMVAIAVHDAVQHISDLLTHLTPDERRQVNKIIEQGSIGALLYFIGMFGGSKVSTYDKRYGLEMYVPNNLDSMITRASHAFTGKAHMNFDLKGESIDFKHVTHKVFVEVFKIKLNEKEMVLIDKNPKKRAIDANTGDLILDDIDDVVVVD